MIGISVPFRCETDPLASASRGADFGSDSRFLSWDFSELGHTSDLKLALQRLPYQRNGVIELALGQFDLQLSISVWQHEHFSEQIRPRYTL